MMRVDMRIHSPIRDQVHAGLSALRVQGRQIWGDARHSLPEIAVRLMVGVGDIARLARRGIPTPEQYQDGRGYVRGAEAFQAELKKEVGNVIFSMVRWADDLGLDVMECLDLAIAAQEKFADSKNPTNRASPVWCGHGKDAPVTITSVLLGQRLAWKAPRCSRCGAIVFRSRYTGTIYTDRNIIHGCQPTAEEEAEWQAKWDEVTRLLDES